MKSITNAEFSNGIFRREGGRRRLVVGGTGLCLERVSQAIKALADMGAIRVGKQGSKDIYEICDGWCHPDLPQDGAYKLWELNESDYVIESVIQDDD